jgi:hypothetical protein
MRLYQSGSPLEGLISPCPAHSQPSGYSRVGRSPYYPADWLAKRNARRVANPAKRSASSADRPRSSAPAPGDPAADRRAGPGREPPTRGRRTRPPAGCHALAAPVESRPCLSAGTPAFAPPASHLARRSSRGRTPPRGQPGTWLRARGEGRRGAQGREPGTAGAQRVNVPAPRRRAMDNCFTSYARIQSGSPLEGLIPPRPAHSPPPGHSTLKRITE